MHISWYFNFLSGNRKIDQFPGREKPGKPGKFCTVTKISKFWGQFGKITKPDQIGQIFLILQMVKALDGIQMLIHSKRSNFGQFWPYFSQFLVKTRKFPGKQQFPGGNFLVPLFLFPGFLPGNVQL